MKEVQPIHKLTLSLGSNMGDRASQIQNAYSLISETLGVITAKSNLYESPSWGFNGKAFLNTCINVNTVISTKEALVHLQEIENILGRQPKQGEAYENRVIDIDILYSSEGVFQYPQLIVPHPRMHERNFVLKPLADIMPKAKHPLLHLSTAKLLECCIDDSILQVYET